ncbi:MAG: GDSL-type esterase/lipase family protein [Firmicutes bacterium]|nr:GDSL-type esterase/lipase family protein [Bacillota bacterium]MCM1402008.1 GDSL-type esterase/lipase family protein [Bacteroides sp.]MCM1477934.1 GDSL-type esterase/lipase family protein [Bacteroides sp.]
MTEEEKEEKETDLETAETNETSNHNPWRVVVIILSALVVLIGLSFLPFEKLTNGKISDFNLLGEIMERIDSDSTEISDGTELIDPALQEAMLDTRAIDTAGVAEGEAPLIAVLPSRQGADMVLEDYTEAGQGLKRMRQSIAQGGVTRVAVIGDSYIEGDIFTQDLREMLQTQYGGSGVGYVNMHSDFPGFRRSVKQGGKGWTEYAANKSAEKRYTGLSQHYFTSTANSTASYKGTDALPHLDSWDNSQFLFISPKNSVIKVKTGEGEWVTHNITGSPEVQAITVNGPTNNFEISTSSPSIIGLGAWMYGSKGVTVDCMSSRGFSGLTLNNVSGELSNQMSKFVDYDLIVLEFGINAMSAKQKDFSVYSNRMVDVIKHVRECFPNADIIMMGIGDRGEKKAGEVHSMASAPYMVNAQRDAARRARCLFYDTRESMGGQDAIVSWVGDGLANKDYIHLTHKGGRKLAEPFFKAIKADIDK